MNKILFLLCFVTGILNAQTEAKLGLGTFVIEGGIMIGLEQNFADFWSVGIDGTVTSGYINVRLLNKMFFNPEKGADKEYVGMFVTNQSSQQRKGIGVMGGYKFVADFNLVIEFEGGYGGWIEDDSRLTYIKLQVGYRINWIKTKRKK